MIIRQVSQLARLGLVVTAAVGVSSVGCEKKSSAPAQSPALTSGTAATNQTFRFAPPDGTSFMRHDKHREERAIVGIPARTVDEHELEWKVDVRKKGDQYRVKQELKHATFKKDGQTLADGDVKDGIQAELVIDRDGNLVEVRGLDKTADRLKELASPGMRPTLEKVITPQYLADVVANRYRVLFGETIGRQAAPGSSWTVTNPPGSFIASRKVTVEQTEPCGGRTCARLRVDAKVDTRVLAEAAVALVASRVRDIGGDPTKITVQSASYGLSGAMLTEPSTMLSHGASIAEIGSVTVLGPNQQQMTVESKGLTEITYSYSALPVASKPDTSTTSGIAAAE